MIDEGSQKLQGAGTDIMYWARIALLAALIAIRAVLEVGSAHAQTDALEQEIQSRVERLSASGALWLDALRRARRRRPASENFDGSVSLRSALAASRQDPPKPHTKRS